MGKKAINNNYSICLLIGLSFLWTGCGYLSWFYHLAEFYDPAKVDMMTEVIGYLFQAAGLAAYILYSRHYSGRARGRYSFALISLAGLMLTALAALYPSGEISLVFGYGMNIVFGIIAGSYISVLADHSSSRAGLVFGAGYGMGSILSYLISIIGGGSFLSDPRVFVIYAIICFLAALLSIRIAEEDEQQASIGAGSRSGRPVLSDHDSVSITIPAMKSAFNYLWLPGITIFLLSCVKSGGFYFTAADLGEHNVSLELSRSFYAAGLIAAGLINDHRRSAGAVLCIAALVFPFFTIIAGNHTDINYLLWILGYIFFGFYSVYRVLLFVDISRTDTRLSHLACAGLLWGRLGDAAGAASGILLRGREMALITLMAILFVICILLFFHLYHTMYMSPAAPPIDYVQVMASRYSLSQRESALLRLILDGSTNKEVAEKLFISENTVKFHVRNLLRKTGCSNRKELLALYDSVRSSDRDTISY